MTVLRGTYKTKCGYRAIVGRVKQYGATYAAHGAIEDPVRGILALHTWNIHGESIQNDSLDLILEEKTSEQ